MQSNLSATDTSPPRPIILGAGLTGLAISRSLSAAGLVHVLVGEPPTETPRLGESLNAEGSLEIARQFPEYGRFFTPKRQQVVFFGDHVLSVDFLPLRTGRIQDVLLGLPATVELLHVDRVGLDRALFEAAIGDPHCSFLEDRANEVVYRRGSDRIEAIGFAGGRRVSSSFVFDCTNHVCFLARQLGVARTQLGPKRRVVFAHYHSTAGINGHPATSVNTASPAAWRNATSLLRLESRTDPCEGLAWCIPLGEYVSLGVSVDPETTPVAAEVLLNWLERAYALRGIDVRRSFLERSEPQDFGYEHYNHERCSGANWLLTGPTCCQFWFPSAAGVATGLVAARLAPDFLRTPRQTSAVYQDYIDALASAHGGLDWLVRDDPWSVTADVLQRRMRAMVGGNIERMVSVVEIGALSRELAFGDAFARLYQADRVLANPIRVEHALPEAQLARFG